MTQYDPQILQRYADKLYSRANGIIRSWTLAGLIAGAVGGWFVEKAIDTGSAAVVLGATAVLGAVVGYMMGPSRAFLLKLTAQQALCYRQIELNTRPRGDAPPIR